MAKTQKRRSAVELGDSGVQIFNGIISSDEYRPELRGKYAFKTYDEMRRGDATVHAGLMAVKYPILSVPWSPESGGEEDVDADAKELVDYNFTEVINWRETLTEMLTMLDFGFYVAELVFDVRSVNDADRVVLVKIAYRKQTTIEKWEQDDGSPGIVQRLRSRPETGVNGAGRRFCFETYQVIEERTYARACTSIADRPCPRQDRRAVRL